MITDDRGILQEFLDRNSKCLADLADMFIQMFVTSDFNTFNYLHVPNI